MMFRVQELGEKKEEVFGEKEEEAALDDARKKKDDDVFVRGGRRQSSHSYVKATDSRFQKKGGVSEGEGGKSRGDASSNIKKEVLELRRDKA